MVGTMAIMRGYLTDYTSSIAGKNVSLVDRKADEKAGSRSIHNIVQALAKARGRAITAFNPSVAVMNAMPLMTLYAVHPLSALKGTATAIRSMFNGGGNIHLSDFYAARFVETDPKTTFDKIVDVGYKPAQGVDKFATMVGFETLYAANLQAGMTPNQAILSADNELRALMGSRNRGEKPLVYGLSPEEAYRTVQAASEEATAVSEQRKGAQVGADTSAEEQAAADARNAQTVPSDIASWAAGRMGEAYIQKGIQLWQETGLDVYPSDISLSENDYGMDGDETRSGITSSNVFYELSSEEIEAMNNEYRVEYKRIILSNDDPGEIEKQLNKSKSRIREKYLENARGGN